MIQVSGLTKRFGGALAVDQVSLAVAPGERVALVGPSGSGKTTLLRLLAGLEAPDAGEIRLRGALVSGPGRQVAPHRRGLGFVFQGAALWPHLTVAGNVAFGLYRWPRAAARERVVELLAQVELADQARRYPHELSGGEARRVALARALASGPNLLLLDEPLTSLDSELKARLLRWLLESTARTGATLVYVTHEAAEAAQVAERVLRMERGRLNGGEPAPQEGQDSWPSA